ncbi:DUF6907 domain-containing protein [Streptomyces sp. NPDC056500]|uniref:DUF6907 domain-containing protein n=1 Tax=Streptomyces sp. NPDC056500 TaxID=3345840 RepID=UPI003689EA78
MSTLRTITVPTLDHGPITITCPDWCTEPHQNPEYRIDLTHAGPDIAFNVETSRGTATLMTAWYEQRPHIGERFPGTRTFINVEINGDTYPSDPRQLDQLAAALTIHAIHLRTLAQQLTALKAVAT